jgi:hypothetical protein
MPDWWDKPFSYDLEGKPWAVLTDKVLLIGIQQENKLPKLDGGDWFVADVIQKLLSAPPKNLRTTSVSKLKDFCTTDDYGTILEFSVDLQRLTKILNKLKGASEVNLWDASASHLAYKTLGLEAQNGKWKAFLMGFKHQWTDVPVYEFEPPPEPEFDVFTELMQAEASEPGSSA